MCEWGNDRIIHVIRRNNPDVPDAVDAQHRHPIAVDACIADYVQCMNDQGVLTVGCCCGHGKAPAVVLVEVESVPLMARYGYAVAPFEDRRDVVQHFIPDSGRKEPT